MANVNRSEEAKRNRRATMVDDAPDAGPTPTAGPDPYAGRRSLRGAASIPLDRIVPDPGQPRKEFDEESMTQLAGSLEARGQLQPIRVRWDEGRGVYVVVVGERRWRAARMAGLERLDCVVMEGAPTAAELLEDQLVENALREGLRPVEQARAYRTLMDSLGLTQRDLAARLKIAQSAISQAISLLDLDGSVQERVDDGSIAPSVARRIAQVPDPKVQATIAAAVVAEGLTYSEVDEVVQSVRSRRPAPARRPDPVSFDLGDCTVTVRWKRTSKLDAVQALRQATRMAQGRKAGQGGADAA